MLIPGASSEFILGRPLHPIFAVFFKSGIFTWIASMRGNIALPLLTLLLRAVSESVSRQRAVTLKPTEDCGCSEKRVP
jgi:hypothetical protein